MSTEANKALVQRAIDTWNARDVDAFVACYSDPLLVLGEGDAGLAVTRDEHREAAMVWWKRFPDLAETTQELMAEGDRVFARTRSTGSLQARWRGIQPTGQQVEWEAWYAYRVQDGLITEERMLMDLWGVFTQLGAIEMPRG